MADRDKWPVPDEVKSASARDAFLWYICRSWPIFFGGDGKIETIVDHDFGYHLLQYQNWQLELKNLDEFPSKTV